MLRLLCTKKLMKHLGTQPTPQPLSLTTTVGDWYANLFTYDNLDIAMCVSEQTRYAIPVSLHDREHDHGLYVGLVWRIHDAIKRLGLAEAIADRIVDEYRGGLIVAPTADRSVLGTMNDLVRLCKHQLDAACDSSGIQDWKGIWKEFEDELNQTPHMALGGDNGTSRLVSLIREIG